MGRLLFVRRAPQLKFGAGKWGFPAGHIESGETPRECAYRELREEIGDEHELQEIRRLGPVTDSYYGGKFEIHLFHFRWLGGSVQLNDEHTAFRWVDSHEFKELDVMLGIDEDIYLLDVWPRSALSPDRLPPDAQPT